MKINCYSCNLKTNIRPFSEICASIFQPSKMQSVDRHVFECNLPQLHQGGYNDTPECSLSTYNDNKHWLLLASQHRRKFRPTEHFRTRFCVNAGNLPAGILLIHLSLDKMFNPKHSYCT